MTVINTPFLVLFATSSVKKYWEGYGRDIVNISKAFFEKEANLLKKKGSKTELKHNNIVKSESTSSQPSVSTISVPPQEKKSPYTTYHCPNCGEKFTEKMFGLLDEHKETYCEFCGLRVDLKIPLSS
jgi:DNA-directed RNA polymerase subunit RPC12/RpoP